MLDSIIRYSLKHRGLVLTLTGFTVIYGLMVLIQLPVDVLPDLNKPTVTVISEAQGMAPEEVEIVVTRPIETVLNGMPGVTRLFSSSTTGLSVVRIQFEWGTDLRFARLSVSERIQLTKSRMPEHITPHLSPTSSIMGEIQMVGITSKEGKTTPTELRTLADWSIRQRLLMIPGISQVSVIGGEELQIQVLVNAEKLRKKLIPIHELQQKLTHLSEASGGGFITKGEKEWLIRNFGRVLNYEEIPNTAVGMHLGVPVLLKEVATVEFGPAPKRGAASVSGKDGVILMIQKQPSADTLVLSEKINSTLKDLRKEISPDIDVQGDLFKQSHFIRSAIGNVEEALRDGSIMVAIILILFLLNVRITFITLTAIPVSLFISFIVFYIMGIGINTMILGGLAIAIGELVDDAIVDVENVFRRLKENRKKGNPKTTVQVIFEASSEVRNSIVLATVIVVLVFIPLFALSGVEGRLFTPIGISYVVSLLASLLVSLTLTPVLCYFLIGKTHEKEMDEDGWLVRKLKNIDKSILEWSLEHPGKVIGATAVIVIASMAVVPFMGRNFLPTFNEGSAMVEVNTRAGISLEASHQLAIKVEQSLLTIPEIISVGRRTGRAEEDEHAAGVNHSEFEVALKRSSRTRQEIFSDIRDKVRAVIPADSYLGVSQPISHRLDHVLSGVKAQVALKLFGGDLRILRQQGAEIRNVIASVPGITDLQVEGQVLFPQYKIYGVREDLARYGITPGVLMDSLEAMLQGVPVTRLIEKERYLEVFMRLDENSRNDIEAIKRIPAHVLPTGQIIPLGDVTDIFETSGPNMIERENLQRRIVISFNTIGRDLDSIVEDAQKKISENVKLPEGYYLEFGGQYESQKEASRKVTLLGIVSLFAVLAILVSHFRSLPVALQIMVNVPLALVGSVTAVLLTDRTFSVATLIAFITLCGIASRNGIMMISHYIHLMREEGESFTKSMIIRGSLERLVPVLMTAFSAILALTPLLFAKDQPGKEILHPVAVVIVGGLLSSTLLDIFVTPAIFYRFGRKSAERLLAKNNTNKGDQE